MIHLQTIVSFGSSHELFMHDIGANSPSVDDTRDPAQDGKTNVDQEIAVAAGLEEDRKRRQEERQEVEAHVGGGGRHDGCGLWILVVVA